MDRSSFNYKKTVQIDRDSSNLIHSIDNKKKIALREKF